MIINSKKEDEAKRKKKEYRGYYFAEHYSLVMDYDNDMNANCAC